MSRRPPKPTSPGALPGRIQQSTIHRPTVQSLPPTYQRPKRRMGHNTKYTRPVIYDEGALAPIKKRAAVFFGIGGGVRFFKR